MSKYKINIISPHPLEEIEEMDVIPIKKRKKNYIPKSKYKPLNEILNSKGKHNDRNN